MERKRSSVTLLLVFMLLGITTAFGQDVDKKVYDADKYFKIRNYQEALSLYLEAIEAGVDDPVVYYRTAVSYQNMFEINEQVKAIPYFEKAIAKGMDQLPANVYYDLAEVYHKDEQIEKALDYYGKYKAALKGNQGEISKVNRALEVANNSLSLMSSPKDITVVNLGQVINSQYTEYNPVVSADESVMAFTALRPNTGKTRSSDKFIEEVYISYNTSGNWSQPKPIKIASNYNVGTAGISADGQKMLIFIGGADGTGNLYTIDKAGDDWSTPVTMGNKINSRSHVETTGSITPDGKTLYFASNRPGGYGGLDIYKSVKTEAGDWGEPVNVGPEVNTKYNEDAPFIHPDQWTLFFTSDGHNTMGGRDIFVTRLFNGKWTAPENMGYPINTTANDNYFTLTADGRKGYFSSDRKGGQGGQDIYSINMPEEEANIPLTMIKGRILNGENNEPIPTTIYVVDVESGKKLDFVYQPDPKTGNYLIILPPSKNYDMIIESEGFLPYTLNINIPGQTYFYELYQKIYLKTIKQFEVVVGQEVEVKNAFYDTHEDAVTDIRKTHEATLVKSDSIDMYDLMNDLIEAQDQEGIDYLVSLINMKNPIEDVNFDDARALESAARVYYYDESDESKFEQKVVNGKTIFSLPTMYVTEEAEKQKNRNKGRSTTYDPALLKAVIKVYFDVAKSELKPSYHQQLNEILETLNKYPELGIQISGYASAEGDEKFNRELSNKRAIAVLDYINHKGVVRRRIIAKGYGATKTESSNKEESRRVEIQIVDLNEHGREVK
ncbi:PD40 domain-containing protein [Fulvivirga sp. 29W222]|uniref:PD40 domain-containing protein n=1 Tax=Fulvivirga marina TaxID=2494733 RepID=A0A937FU62_9BACT|nr:OmpA family protein [Fulvivirga marina]MBL6445899.1 PD40 domain-containing protein [Fulvivirga marina]